MFLKIVHVVPAFVTTHFVAPLSSNPDHRAIMEVPESFTLLKLFCISSKQSSDYLYIHVYIQCIDTCVQTYYNILYHIIMIVLCLIISTLTFSVSLHSLPRPVSPILGFSGFITVATTQASPPRYIDSRDNL